MAMEGEEVKARNWIILVVVVAALVAVGWWGKRYYENRYVSSNYYAVIPQGWDVSPRMETLPNGKQQPGRREYKVQAYDATGLPRELFFTVAPETSKYPKPGDYVLVRASKQIATGWNLVSERQIPQAALHKIKSR